MAKTMHLNILGGVGCDTINMTLMLIDEGTAILLAAVTASVPVSLIRFIGLCLGIDYNIVSNTVNFCICHI